MDDRSELFERYGRVMFEAQTFELTVRGLLTYERPTKESDPEELSAEIERLFKRPLARIAKALSVTEELAEEMQAGVNTRNSLAHEFLVISAVRINTGGSTVEEEIGTLQFAQSKFESLNERLDPVYREAMISHGYDPDDMGDVESIRRAFGPAT